MRNLILVQILPITYAVPLHREKVKSKTDCVAFIYTEHHPDYLPEDGAEVKREYTQVSLLENSHFTYQNHVNEGKKDRITYINIYKFLSVGSYLGSFQRCLTS